MEKRIMIDPGLISRNSCAGKRTDVPEPPAFRIGESLTESLDCHGYETLFAASVPGLNDPASGSGRPSQCAGIANQWGADCLLRICVRAAEHPLEGSAGAMVFRQRGEACELAGEILNRLETLGLRNDGIRTSPHVVLLRKCRCPSVILILRLPFRQKELLTWREVAAYAGAIAEGIFVRMADA